MTISKESMISHQYVKECINYNPNTGIVTWKVRPSCHFKNSRSQKIWNSRFSGKNTGTPLSRNKTGITHLVFGLNSKVFFLHRVIWLLVYGAWPENQIDHCYGDGTNNKLSNLRDVSPSQNNKNQPRHSNNTSGITGVRQSHSKWCAEIGTNGKNIYLGTFNTIFDAACARKSAERMFGYHENHGR